MHVMLGPCFRRKKLRVSRRLVLACDRRQVMSYPVIPMVTNRQEYHAPHRLCGLRWPTRQLVADSLETSLSDSKVGCSLDGGWRGGQSLGHTNCAHCLHKLLRTSRRSATSSSHRSHSGVTGVIMDRDVALPKWFLRSLLYTAGPFFAYPHKPLLNTIAGSR